jgi:hypothetical protein
MTGYTDGGAEIIGEIPIHYIDGTKGTLGIARTEKTVAIRHVRGDQDSLIILSYSIAETLAEMLLLACDADIPEIAPIPTSDPEKWT